MAETKNLPVPKGASKVNNQLVEDASNEIKSILLEHLGAASYEVVDYLLKTFFDGKKENLKKKKLEGHKSFQKLLFSIQDVTGKSKSWLYEAIKLWLDRDLLEDCDEYMELSISHRALLLKEPDVKEKKKLAKQFLQDKTSYKDAKKLLRPSSPQTDYSLVRRLINHPGDFAEKEFKEKANKKYLKKVYEDLSKDQQFEIVKKAKERVNILEEKLKEQKDLLTMTKSIKKFLDEVSADVGAKSKE